ncbi:MAG: hypothetical protein A2167_08590 [Planctomycetes bacterium RBG_13_46_10]|nr:MAG: hypothetical protein A2167_08590 [Planctomycetes bacterium RBG_13_46_10]
MHLFTNRTFGLIQDGHLGRFFQVGFGNLCIVSHCNRRGVSNPLAYRFDVAAGHLEKLRFPCAATILEKFQPRFKTGTFDYPGQVCSQIANRFFFCVFDFFVSILLDTIDRSVFSLFKGILKQYFQFRKHRNDSDVSRFVWWPVHQCGLLNTKRA